MKMQEVLDRASVGRSTFYLHFRDKNDLLLSELEKFLEMMSTALSIRKEESRRVVPVAELFVHIGNRRRSIARWPTLAVSTISSISRKATFPAGLSSASGNSSVFRSFRNVNWLLAPSHWPEACYRCCDGGLIVER